MIWGHTCWTVCIAPYHVTQSIGTKWQSERLPSGNSSKWVLCSVAWNSTQASLMVELWLPLGSYAPAQVDGPATLSRQGLSIQHFESAQKFFPLHPWRVHSALSLAGELSTWNKRRCTEKIGDRRPSTLRSCRSENEIIILCLGGCFSFAPE